MSDALVALGEELGGLIVDVKMYSPEQERGQHKIIGPAYTVRVGTVTADSGLWLTDADDLCR